MKTTPEINSRTSHVFSEQGGGNSLSLDDRGRLSEVSGVEAEMQSRRCHIEARDEGRALQVEGAAGAKVWQQTRTQAQ